MWREARFRTKFHATHDEYLDEPFQRSIILIELAEMEDELRSE